MIFGFALTLIYLKMSGSTELIINVKEHFNPPCRDKGPWTVFSLLFPND